MGSIYADIEEAVDLQRRIAGIGEALTEEERSTFESSEDIRLDHLRELRLAAIDLLTENSDTLRAAPLPRGRRFDSIRAARDIALPMAGAQRRLLSDVVGQLGWTMIAICLHSANFRTRFLDATNVDDFPKRLDLLRSHRQGVGFFAKSRLFDWLQGTPEQQAQDVLFRDLNCLLTETALPESREVSDEEAENARLNVATEIAGFPDDDTGIDHPHEWELSADGDRVTRLTFFPGGPRGSPQLQRNIDESVVLFAGQKWEGRSKWLLRDEPRYRSDLDDRCAACHNPGEGEDESWTADCHCTVDNLKTRLAASNAYFGERIELRHTHPIIGTGVRALQRLLAGSLLGEYVGEIYPANSVNTLYHSSMYLYNQARRQLQGEQKVALYIEASVKGNWTRYINHSCRANTEFLTYSCGEKIITCVTVGKRAIEFGEEITVNYGSGYFVGQKLACRCAEDKCLLWNADAVENNKMTLLQAKKEGISPDWAV